MDGTWNGSRGVGGSAGAAHSSAFSFLRCDIFLLSPPQRYILLFFHEQLGVFVDEPFSFVSSFLLLPLSFCLFASFARRPRRISSACLCSALRSRLWRWSFAPHCCRLQISERQTTSGCTNWPIATDATFATGRTNLIGGDWAHAKHPRGSAFA